MSKQNIFDNSDFFNGYKSIRENPINENNLFEVPSLMSMLPDISGMEIMDLGCGFGEHCVKYVEMGAKSVVGVDISSRMLDVARAENSLPRIEYICMPMEDIGQLGRRFDIVISSLAMHYVKDFRSIVQNIHDALRPGGFFIFSQEHPVCTCYPKNHARWTKDNAGGKICYNMSGYGIEGERSTTWVVDDVIKYHRTFSTIINALTESGFVIRKIEEPIPSEELLKEYPQYSDLLIKPNFLVIKAMRE